MHRLSDIDPSTKPVPEGWEPDCANCAWHLENCTGLYLFQSLWDGEWHVNGTPNWKDT